MVTPHPPFHEKVFNPLQARQITRVINQLYPNKLISFLPHYYKICGKVTLGDDLIGSRLPGGNNKASSIIMAYWSGSGDNLLEYDRSRMRVGEVQYFILHSVQLSSSLETRDSTSVPHIFAYVMWKKLHIRRDYFGASSTVSADEFEPPSLSCYLPVQRISCRAAHAVMCIKFEHASESIFIACPLPVTYHI